MRAGETVLVCGASADKAQFVPFEWPTHAVVWISVRGYNTMFLDPGPRDADSDARHQLARAYVEAVGAVDAAATEAAVVAVESWLRLIERAARVPCTLLVASGGVRVTAVPIYEVTWTARWVTVVCARFRRVVRRKHDAVEQDVFEVLSKRGVCATPDLVATFRVVRHGRSMDLLPYERCALCNAEIRSRCRDAVPFFQSGQRSRDLEWLPRPHVCASCPVRAFTLHAFHFEVREGHVHAVEKRGESVRLYRAEQSVWQARGGIIETLALALACRAVPKTAFAAALATALCDLKLLRVVAARMRPPEAKTALPRAISLLVAE